MIDTKVLADEKRLLQSKIDLLQAMNRLELNPDFVQVFKIQYCNKQMQELVSSLAHLKMGCDEHTKAVQALQAVSSLMGYMEKIKQDGAMAQQSLSELNAIPLSEYDNE